MNIDETYMSRALQLARNGYGRVSPNPMVGAVIVADGRIIGEGYHRKWGFAHAEVNAIASVQEADRYLLPQSTIYVTLEPCSHYGKTPPCSKLIVDTGIRRVVVGCLDPFKEVSGRGIKMLRDAGIEVVTGVLEQECRAVNRRFIEAHTQHRPWVTLKWAETADRFVDSDADERTVISSAVTMTLMHRLRAGYDAIMVGANTVARDNPSLLTRLWPCRKQPLRVVMSHTGCGGVQDRRIFSDGNATLLYSSTGHTIDSTLDGVEEAALPGSLADVLADLYRRGVTSLLVEGGPTLHRAFLDSGLWDDARIERSADILGLGVAAAPMPCGRMKTETVGNRLIINVRK